MNIKSLLLSTTILFSIAGFAQSLDGTNSAEHHHKNPDAANQCAAHERHLQMMENNPEYAQEQEQNEQLIQDILDGRVDVGSNRDQILTVPIVVHIVHTGQDYGVGPNISDAQVYSAIEALNEDYRKMAGTNGDGDGVDCEIEFCLAQRDPDNNPSNGINRVDGSSVPLYEEEGITVGQGQGASEMAIKNLSRWPNDEYYNIWVVSEIENNNAGAGIQGYAYYPTSSPVDGTTILFNAFGTTGTLKSYTNMNRTTSHELGHALNLFHTFQGGSCSESNCNVQGDRVCDTPPTILNSSCGNPACGGTQQVNNYMDYTSQWCKDMFTAGQRDRMRAALLGPRSSLLESQACEPVDGEGDFPPVAEFSASSTEICVDGSVDFTDESLHNPTSWTWNFPGATPGSSNDQNPQNITYDSPGNYTIYLTVSNEFGDDTETKTGYISVGSGDCTDCAGVQGGDAYLDNCGECVGGSTGEEPCEQDCAGEWGGNAYLDDCEECVGGNTGEQPCEQDCAGTWGGSAFVDNCGECVGGSTGEEACDQDCAGVWGGDAYLDNCNDCVGGNTGNNPCEQDCAGDWGGNAYLDDCGSCVGGSTGEEPCVPCDGFSADISITSDVTCPGGNDGSAQVSASGGTQPYFVEWSHNGSLSNPTATDIPAGNHSVTISDSEGCETSLNFTIDEPNPIALSDSGTEPVSCNEENDGSAWISAAGGTGTLSASWSPSGATGFEADNLTAGIHTVTVTDNEGCSAQFDIEVGEEDCPDIPQLMVMDDDCDVHDYVLSDNIHCEIDNDAIAYEWRFENVGSGQVHEYVSNGTENNIRLEQVPGLTYNESYDVSVRSKRSYGWGEFGESCPISIILEIPSIQLSQSWCGNNSVYPWNTLSTNNVSQAEDYQWQFVDQDAGTQVTLNRGSGQNDFPLSLFEQVSEDNEYQVRIRVKMFGAWGDFGPTCTIQTANLSPDIITPVCGENINLWQELSCEGIEPANNYRWQFVDEENGDTLIYLSQGLTNCLPLNVDGIEFNRSYSVNVTPRVNGNWNYTGNNCSLFITDDIPEVNLTQESCNLVNHTESGEIEAEPLEGAEQYLFHFTKAGSDSTHLYFSESGSNTLPVSELDDLLHDELYNIKTRGYALGTWGPWGNECQFVIGELSSGPEFRPYIPTVIYPNPGDGSMLNVITDSAFNAGSEVRIYTAHGTLVTTASLAADNGNKARINIPSRLASGMYYVRLKLADGPKVIKYVVK